MRGCLGQLLTCCKVGLKTSRQQVDFWCSSLPQACMVETCLFSFNNTRVGVSVFVCDGSFLLANAGNCIAWLPDLRLAMFWQCLNYFISMLNMIKTWLILRHLLCVDRCHIFYGMLREHLMY